MQKKKTGVAEGFFNSFGLCPPPDSDYRWNRPGNVNGTWNANCSCYKGPEMGWGTFMSHLHLNRRSFLKNDDLIITADFDGSLIWNYSGLVVVVYWVREVKLK